ncbi:MAG: hypothetical protein ACOY0S_03480 [Patescibacteria group bacterium]
MVASLSYSLGYFQGRLKAYETEEDLFNLVKLGKNKKAYTASSNNEVVATAIWKKEHFLHPLPAGDVTKLYS